MEPKIIVIWLNIVKIREYGGTISFYSNLNVKLHDWGNFKAVTPARYIFQMEFVFFIDKVFTVQYRKK